MSVVAPMHLEWPRSSDVTIIRSARQLEEERPGWEAIASRFGTPLLDHDWFLAAAQWLHAADHLHVVCVRRSDRLVGVAPLVLRSGSGHLVLMGADVLHEPGGVLFEDDEALSGLLHAMAQLAWPVLIPRVPTESALCQTLGRAVRGRAVPVLRATSPSLGIAVTRDWERYWGSLSRRMRSDFQRLETRVRRDVGELDARVVMPGPADVDHLLDQLVEVEGSGWKARNGSALRQRPALHAFFRDYARRAAVRGQLRVVSVTFGGELAAMELGVRAHERVFQLKVGFQDRFAAYSPGQLATRASIRTAFAEGVRSFEFLGSAEPWEHRWRPEVRSYSLVALYPFSVRSVTAACRDVASNLWRRVPWAVQRTA